MIIRYTSQRLSQSLEDVPAVALLGARQVGKTTLAKEVGRQLPSVYLDLESPEDLMQLQDPIGFFKRHSNKLVILDEIQRAPDLFMVLRGVIDERRQLGQRSGQFLLLGSASMALMRQSSESLAGRIRYIEMGGLHALEIDRYQSALQRLWFRGGFPESYLAASDDLAMDWLEDMVRTYLERDVPQMGFKVPSVRLRRLWTMLAHAQGEGVNAVKLGSNLEINAKTVNRYLELLVDLLLLRRLDPWHSNAKKRLVKSPRYYIRDSGMVHRLLGIDQPEHLLSHPVLGKSWEGFVMENLHLVLPHRSETYFYRTAVGAEIDLVIKLPSSEIWAVEIKYGRTPKLPRHYSHICDEIGATRKYIVYGGDKTFSVGDGVTMIALHDLMQALVDLHRG